MIKSDLLYAFAAVFGLGAVAGFLFSILFQSYVFILALIGLVSLAAKAPSFIKRFWPKNKDH
jgi:hypothetical protein